MFSLRGRQSSLQWPKQVQPLLINWKESVFVTNLTLNFDRSSTLSFLKINAACETEWNLKRNECVIAYQGDSFSFDIIFNITSLKWQVNFMVNRSFVINFFLIFVYFLVLSLFFVSFASVGFTEECLGFSSSVLFGVLSIIWHGST